tara:strand:- start:1139 stop:1540 length:402 start_codon:yes stop_codon:yes gene_type:complete
MNTTNDNQSLTVYSESTNREQLIENVQKWVILDQQLQLMNEKSKKIREMKSLMTANISDYVRSNNLKTNIGISNGELRIYDKKDYKPLTFTYVEKSLNAIIKDKSHVDFIIKYLKDNREITISSDIKRISTKL